MLAFVNSDAIVAPDCLAVLREEVVRDGPAVVGALVTLAERPERVNSSGNPLHVLGLSWAGGLGDSVAALEGERTVASVSGAAFAIARQTFAELGGFGEDYFAYLEDLDLCWRAWQRGIRVLVLPRARAAHHYEFARNPRKLYLLERNRLLLLATVHHRRTLGVLLPVLLAFEVAILLVAARQGWIREKLAGYGWLLRHARRVVARRRQIQRARIVEDAQLAWLLTTRLDQRAVELPPGVGLLERLLEGYWRVARRML